HGTVSIRTGAVEPDITAMSLAIPTGGKLGMAVSIIGPDYRFTKQARGEHQTSLLNTVDALVRELRINGEDFTS
ncbi:MAG: hypothetical protein HKN03_04455, partial [Acidimicrobiales bacterium]|nr:hypothetical protein [Acidimicrobiales bacterium]